MRGLVSSVNCVNCLRAYEDKRALLNEADTCMRSNYTA